MLPTSADLETLVRQVAAEELLSRFREVEFEVKADQSLVTEADYAVQARLIDELNARWPDIGLLGEEMNPDEQAAALATGQPLWCLDPLDGTSNFVAGIPYFCISLALLVDGKQRLGVVHDPTRDETFCADAGGGARLNGRPLTRNRCRPALDKAVAMVDFKRLDPALAGRLATDPPFASQRNFGSSALDWAWVAAERVHVYLHGGQKLWDFAAGSLIMAEAGGHSCTLEGEPVFTAAMGARSVVAARDENLFATWKQAIGIANTP